ncbi:MAG: DUF711 family protein [Caldisphaeraceae archaeon]|nr:DUF711 family protein [Caldisphaeraceae archaeon]MEB3797700.1 DUF711 family protein [Caldisphaeraceae archaeon]
MYSIRALTVHYGKPRKESSFKEEVESFLYKLQEAVDNYKSVHNIRPGTLRIAFPSFPSDYEGLLREFEDLADDFLINLGQMKLNAGLGDALRDVASSSMFSSILLSESTWDAAVKISKALHSLVAEDPSYGANVGVNTFNYNYFITPYFPLASAIPGEVGISVCLTYPNYLSGSYLKNGYEGLVASIREAGEKALEMGEFVSKELGVKYYGVDLSVSPWMEESSLGLIEAVSGVRLTRPGFASGLKRVNDAVLEASNGIKTTGFNEVMLPIAEDSRLKARASEGEVSARYLAMLSGACLAGLDLAVVPSDVDGVAGLILDVSAYSKTKKRVLGVRIIPVDGVEPGDKVDLGRFGFTPVIAI